MTDTQASPTDEIPTSVSSKEKEAQESFNLSQKPKISPPLSHKTAKKKSAHLPDSNDFSKEDGIGYWGATVHIVRLTIGSGILVMPYSMKNLGCLSGTILIILVGILYYHNIHIWVSTENHLCQLLQVKRLSFIGVIRKSFQRAPFPINKFNSLICFLTYVYLSLPTSQGTYLVVISTNIQLMAKYYDIELNQKLVITFLIIPFILFCQVRRILQILVPFSSITNVFTLIMATVLVACSFIYRETSPSIKILGDVHFIPKGFAMFILAIRCTGIMLPLKNDMKNPQRFSQWSGPVNVAGLCIILLYYTFAVITYINYGDAVQENILSNLPPKNVFSFSVYFLYTLALSVTYILYFYSCFDCLWSSQLESCIKDGVFKTICEGGVRLGINIAAYLLAVAVPQISLIAAIAGTLGFIVDIALPPFLEILLQIHEKRISCITTLKDLFIIVISGILFCMSTARCVRDVIKMYSE